LASWKFYKPKALGAIGDVIQCIKERNLFLSCEQSNWVALVLSPFLRVVADSPSDSQLKIKVRRFEDGACRIIISAKNVSIYNRKTRTSEFFIGKTVCGHLNISDGCIQLQSQKGDMFYLSQFSEWKVQCRKSVIVGIILPCDDSVRSDKAGSVGEWNRLKSQLKFSDIERIANFKGGFEFLARCVQGDESIRFTRRYRVLTMIFRNIQKGDLQSKQLAIDLGVTNAAICAYKINKQLSVSEYFRLLRSFKRYIVDASREN